MCEPHCRGHRLNHPGPVVQRSASVQKPTGRDERIEAPEELTVGSVAGGGLVGGTIPLKRKAKHGHRGPRRSLSEGRDRLKERRRTYIKPRDWRREISCGDRGVRV